MTRFLKRNLELIFWVSAMVALIFTNPAETHFVICPLKLVGFDWCPGCGLGHAIAWLFKGDISASWHAHWLGIPALLIIAYRICLLTFNELRYHHFKLNTPQNSQV